MPRQRRGAETPEDAFSRQLGEARKALGLSLRELDERLARIGSRVNYNRLWQIENGKKATRVRLNEALEIAYALGVNPLSLILPRQSHISVKLGGKARLTENVHNWFVGLPLEEHQADSYRGFQPEWKDRAEEQIESDMKRDIATARRAQKGLAQTKDPEISILLNFLRDFEEYEIRDLANRRERRKKGHQRKDQG